ncbi:hypothetical protein HYV12_04210 [Candidatus Dojkabacteria bacterium]|nr:hypothetical protein [Candidatus Dojkabacteria bacterium]
MEPKTNQTTNSSPASTPNQPADTTAQQPPVNNAIVHDYLVTQKIDPSLLPKDQVAGDLELFKEAEEKMYSKTPNYIRATRDLRSSTLPTRPLTEVDILKIKNPFRGE